MWKLVVLALLCALAESRLREKEYKVGREYVYDYATQIINGMPGESNVYSGIKLKARVKLQFPDETTAKIMLENVLIMKVNDEITDADPTNQIMPDSMFQTMAGEEIEIIERYLTTPCQFTYIRGHVTDIQSEKDEPLWATNIKRGIVSLFEMNIDTRHSMQEDELYRISAPVSATIPINFRTTVEPTPAGICETSYEVRPHAAGAEEEFIVTKVRDYKKCLDRPAYTKTMAEGYFCSECEKEKIEPIKSTGRVEYSMTGNRKRFVIVSAYGVEHNQMQLYSAKVPGKIAVNIRQYLVLADVTNAREQLPQLARPFICPEGLKMDMVAAYQRHPSPLIPEAMVRKIERELEEGEEYTIKLVDVVMNRLLEEPKFRTFGSAADAAVIMVQTFRNASANAIRKIIKKYTASPPAREVLFSLLPSCGTKACTMAMFDAIKENLVPVEDLNYATIGMVMSTFPDEEIIRECVAFARNPAFAEHRHVWKSAWMRVGAWGQKLSQWNKTTVEEIRNRINDIQAVLANAKPRHVETELLGILRKEQEKLDKITIFYIKMKQEILSALSTLLQSAEPEKQLLGVVALGNTGFKEIISLVTPFMAEGRSRILRINALMALRKAAWKIPTEAAAMLLPIFLNREEHHDVRIVAYKILMESGPNENVINMVAGSLRQEKCLQVGGFVYTHLLHMSNTSHPCWYKFAKKAAFALELGKKFEPARLASQFNHISYFSPNYMMGGAIDVSIIGSHESVFPKGGSIKFNTHVLGYNSDLLEIGFHSESLKKVVSKLFGPGAAMNFKKSLFDILKRRSARDVSAGETQAAIQAIIEKLGIQPRVGAEPWAHAYVRGFGNEYSSFTLDENLVMDILQSGAFGISWNAEALKIGKSVNLRFPGVFTIGNHYIPSGAGIPIAVNMESGNDVRLKGTVALDIKNSGLVPKKIDLSTDLILLQSYNFVWDVAVDLPFISAGANYKTKANSITPWNMVATLDLAKQKVFTKFTMPPKAVKKINLLQVQRTYIAKPNLVKPSMPSISYKIENLNIGAKMERIDKTFNIAGLSTRLQSVVAQTSAPHAHWFPLTGVRLKALDVKTIGSEPVVVEFQAQLTDANVPFGGAGRAQPPRPREDSSSLWSYLGSWVPAAPGGGEREDIAVHSDFHNLKQKDVSVHEIAEKLNKPLTDTSGGETYGLVLVMSAGGGEKQYAAQCEMLVTEGEAPTEKTVAMRYRQTPLSEKESEPWEAVFNARVSLPSVEKTVDAVLEPEHQGKILHEIREKLPLIKVEQLTTLLPTHYVKQIKRTISYAVSPVAVDEILVQLIARLPLPNKGLMKSIIADQIAAETTLKRVFHKAVKPLFLQYLVMDLKKIADLCGTVIDKVQEQGLAQSPTEIPLIHYILAKQIRLHAKLERIVEVAKTISRTRVSVGQCDTILNQVQEQQKVIMQHQIRLTKSIPIRQAAEEREIVSTMTQKDAQLYGNVQELERQQGALVKDLYEHGIDALRGILETHVKAISKVQDGIIGAVESGHIPDEKIVIKAAGIMISQEQIIRAVMNRLPLQGRNPNRIPKEVLSLLPVLQLRTTLMIKSIPVISDIIEHNVIVTPNLPKRDKALYQLLLQTEVQQSFLALKSAFVGHQKPCVEREAYISHIKQYLLTAQQLLDILNTRMVENDFLTKGLPLEVLIKIIKVATWHEEVCIQCLTAARFNPKVPFSEIRKLLEENEIKLWERAVDIINKLKPVIEAYKSSLMEAVAIEPVTDNEVIEIQAVQARAKKVLESIAKRGVSSPIVLGKTIRKIVRICKIINGKLRMIVRGGGVQETAPQMATNQLSALKEGQQEIISGLIKIIEKSEALPNTEALMRKALIQKAELEGVIAILGGASAIPGIQAGVGAGVGGSINAGGQIGAEKISPYGSRKGVGAGSWLGRNYGTGLGRARKAGFGGIPTTVGAISAKLSVDATLAVGYKGSMKEKMIIKVIGQKSLAQLLWEFEQATLLGRDKEVRKYVIDKVIGRGPISLERYRLQKEVNMYRDVNVIINFEQAVVSRNLKVAFLYTRDIMKACWFRYLHMSVPEEAVNPDTILMQFEIAPNNEEMDIVLRTREEVATFSNIRIPPECRRRFLADLPLGPFGGPGGPPEIKVPGPVFSPGICEISGRFIRTTDGIVYPVGAVPGCEAVVAMDCSPRSLFAVKVAGIKEEVKSMAITVLVGGHTVVVKPVSVGETVVLLNGKAVVVPEGQTVVVNGEGSAMSSATIKLTKISNIVTVEAPIAGVAVVADVAKIRVKVSPYYMGQICGLCGNFDREPGNEFEDPNMSVYAEPEPFWSKYMLPSATCDANTLTQKFQRYAPLSQGGCLPTLQTEVYPRRVGREKEICFSTEAVNKCPKTCVPVGAATKAVGFYCIRAGEPRAQELLQQSMVKPIPAATLPRVDFEKELAIPQGCQAA